MWNYQIEENILYEDKEILVCRKTAGMPVQAAKIGTMDMESALKNYLAQKTPGKIPYLGVVHRLDQPVEGILVFAKTSEAAGNLSKQMMAGGTGKYYLAVTEGKAKSSEGTLTDYLKKNGKANMSQVGLPLLGDRKYNPSGEKGTSLGLCSSCLEFKHPRTGKMMKFETEPQGSAFLDFVKKV